MAAPHPHFKTLGPYPLCVLGDQLEALELKKFWPSVDSAEGIKVSAAAGVYILAIAKGKAFIPIYVGRAEHGFRARLKPAHDAFRKAAREYVRESAHLLLIARVTSARGDLVRKREAGESLKSIRDLEVMLIRDLMRSGAKLLNVEEKLFFERLVVPGYWNDQKSPKSSGSKALSGMLRGKTKRN